ncbi:hypothetical protein [Halovivax sp.]|uniref:hypothetical protein n=1 Tax=Halovivax sp. TaxID=1935978 RepID=UPI0025B9975B|nr:hypothetical protein [Halovivax sp.]
MTLLGSTATAALAGCADRFNRFRDDSTDEPVREGAPSVGTPVETFDDPFETDEDEWSGAGGAALSFTTTDVYAGDRSVEIGAEGDASGRLEWEPAEPVDLADRDFSIAVRIEGEPDELAGDVDLLLTDADGDEAALRAGASSTSVLTESDEWMRIDFGRPSEPVEELDRSRIASLALDPWALEDPIYVDDLRGVPRADRAYVVFDVDNPERKGDLTYFLDAFHRWDVPCTMGVDAVYARDEAETMGLDWLRDAQADGHEVCSKLTADVVEEAVGADTSDLPSLSREEQAAAIEYNRHLLLEHDLDSGRETIVYTYNNWDADTRAAATEFHSWGRQAGTGFTGLQVTEPFGLPGHNIDEPDVAAEKRNVDRAVEHGLFLNLYFHPEYVTEDELDELLEHCEEYAREDRLVVVTRSELSERVDVVSGGR